MPTRRTSAADRRVWLLSLACLTGACASPGQVFVSFDIPDARPTDVLRVRLYDAARAPVERFAPFEVAVGELDASSRLPIVVEPESDAPVRFEIYAEQRRDGRPIASVYAGAYWLPGEQRHLRLALHPDCPSSCRLDETCVDGACAPACRRTTLDAGALPPHVPCDEDLMGACAECERAVGGRCEPIEDGTACGCPGDVCIDGTCVAESRWNQVAAGLQQVCAAQHYRCDFEGSDASTCSGPCVYGETCSEFDRESVVCWGDNEAGQIGVTDPAPVGMVWPSIAPLPGRMAFGYGIATSAGHSCFVSWDAVLRCVGNNDDGQLGADGPIPRGEDHLVRVPAGREPVGNSVRGWVRVAVGAAHTCAALVPELSGASPSATDPVEIYCWGSDDGEALGDGSGGGARSSAGPILLAGSDFDAVDLAAHGQVTCAVLEGQLVCWGSGGRGVLGAAEVRPDPIEISLDATPIEVGVGSDFLCVRTAEDILCRGVNDGGELGRGGLSEGETTFAPIDHPGPWRALAVGRRHACAVHAEDGETYCWGQNRLGELGPAVAGGNRAEPTVAGIEARLVELTAGDAFTCGRTDDGALYCWGRSGPATGGEARDGDVHRLCPPPLSELPVGG